MKRNLKSKFILFTVIALVTLASCGQGGKHAEHADTYTCPMHPTVISDRPGKCPVCGMDLVRKARTGESVEITEELAKLLKSPNQTIVASIKTIKGEFKSVPVSLEVQGVVTYDTRNIYTIPTRVSGRLEKIFLKYAFQPVAKGQKVAEIYSPELITAQRELIFLLENDAENTPLIEASKSKLELLGVTPSQIKTLIEKKQATNTFSVFSTHSGYLINAQKAPSTAVAMPSEAGSTAGGMDEMGGAASNSPGAPVAQQSDVSGSILKEGSYVSAGQTLFSIVNNEALRIELDIPAKQVGSISQGDKLRVDFGNGSTQQASVNFVQPFFNAGQDFLKLRVYTKKIQGLHIGHLVTAKIQLSPSEALWVPKEAVLDLGNNKVVFIKDRGVLKPKKIMTGVSSEGLIQVTSGLSSSDEIAANSQYLVDSESFIKTMN